MYLDQEAITCSVSENFLKLIKKPNKKQKSKQK